MLTVESIDLHYGAAQALRQVSVGAERGKITCVLGRNGVGKSSLLRAIVGHQPVSSGRILFEGQDITRMRAHERARRGIAYVPQGREIFPLLTVRENLETGYARLPADKRKISEELFELFPGAEIHAGAPRRRSLRWPAAAARHRPRPRHGAAAPGARRAD